MATDRFNFPYFLETSVSREEYFRADEILGAITITASATLWLEVVEFIGYLVLIVSFVMASRKM